MATDPSRQALRDLRRARRRRYLDPQIWIDTLYRVYLIAIFGALAIALISGALDDAQADRDAVDEITGRGPALLGLLAALGLAGGLRSGARGGPLAIEAADVQHVGLIRPFSLMLADEPFDGLDPRSRTALLELLQEAAAGGAAVVVSTHRREVGEVADRCLGLYDGELAYDGPPSDSVLAGILPDSEGPKPEAPRV